MTIKWLLTIILCLADRALACWNGSEVSLGLSHLTVYNVSVDAENILKGPLYQLGNYDDCVYKRKQQYCMVNVYLHPGQNASTLWHEKKKLSTMKLYYRRDRLFVGLCVPESCNSTQVQQAMLSELKPAADRLGIDASVVLEPQNCQDRNNKPIVFADYLMCLIILVAGVLLIIGSIYEYRISLQNQGKTDYNKVAQVLVCFSVRKNWKRLCNVSSSPKLKALSSFQGVRFITSIFIIVGHEGYGMMFSPKNNPEWIEQSYSEVMRMLFLNGHLITCSFFVMSGFLLTYLGIEDYEKNFSLCSYLKSIAQRYIRLTPAFAVVIVMSAGWLNHFGSGPIWPEWGKSEVDNCRDNWWINLLYLQNYLYPDKICLAQSWYLAVDFQSFVLFSLVLGLISKYKSWINVTFVSILAICIFIPFIQTYMEALDPTYLIYPENLLNIKNERTYLRSYITFHHTAGAYFIGIVFGYIFYKSNTKSIKFSKPLIALMWIVSLTLPWTVMLIGYIFYQPNYEYNVILASVYAALNKTLFATGITTILLLCCTGYGGIMNTILSGRYVQVLGRLTYSMYLIHPLILRAEYCSLKHNLEQSDYFLLSKTATHTVFTVFFSIILCLSVEMPFSALLKLITSSKLKVHEQQAVTDGVTEGSKIIIPNLEEDLTATETAKSLYEQQEENSPTQHLLLKKQWALITKKK